MLNNNEIRKLYEEYKQEFNKEQIVLGDGNTNSTIMLIGEAPGKEEVKLLKPFVGAAGKNLDIFINLIGIKREAIFLTNVIKYRLFKNSEKTGNIVNRKASKEDVLANINYLKKEIQIISPKIIVTLGNVALNAVMNNFVSKIGQLHGTLQKVVIINNEYKVFPLYHPASIIYNRKLIEEYKVDISKLVEIIKLLD